MEIARNRKKKWPRKTKNEIFFLAKKNANEIFEKVEQNHFGSQGKIGFYSS